MKKILWIAAVALVAVACSPNKEQQAQGLIKEYIANNLPNPDTYVPGAFGTLDTAYTSYAVEGGGQLLEDQITFLSQHAETARELYNGSKSEEFLDSCNARLGRAQAIKQQMDREYQAFVPKANGWKLEHKFQIKGEDGETLSSLKFFYFDDKVSHITRMSDL